MTEKWYHIPCRYCLLPICRCEEFPPERITEKIAELPEDERNELRRLIIPAGVKYGMAMQHGWPCAALNLWKLKVDRAVS